MGGSRSRGPGIGYMAALPLVGAGPLSPAKMADGEARCKRFKNLKQLTEKSAAGGVPRVLTIEHRPPERATRKTH